MSEVTWTPKDGPSREELAQLAEVALPDGWVAAAANIALAAHDLYEENQRLKAALRLQEETTTTVTRQNMKLHEDRECLREDLAEAKRLVVNTVLPYEALLMDAESQRWIAPIIWDDMTKGVNDVRRFIAGDTQSETV